MTLLVQDYLSQSAQRYPDKCAVICESGQISYRALDEFSNAFARQLTNKGAARGELVPIARISPSTLIPLGSACAPFSPAPKLAW
jgi:non-ribosomal peptide synthetase component E (peptide arylation enzyme)